MATPAFIVDAFTSMLFKGNQAAVCVLDEEKPASRMQQVAAEFNLSETAFLQHQANNQWHLRWFTPACEVKLCGHATLASAHVLARELGRTDSEFLFSTLSGVLSARVTDNDITLAFPKIEPVCLSKIYVHDTGIDQLNLNIRECYRAGEDILMVCDNEKEVSEYLPEIGKIAAMDTRGLIITARSGSTDMDFVSRFFAPRVGINEDPVTGSAHCSLAVYWGKKLEKNAMRAAQVSKRGGLLQLVVDETNVNISGQCVTFLRGNI